VEGGRRRGGDEPRHAEREQAGVLGVLGLDVLEGRQARGHARVVQVGGQRPQDEDAGDRRVDVELGDLADDLAECRIGRHGDRARKNARLPRVAVDAPLVDRRGVVVAHKHRRDADLAPARAQVRDLRAHCVEQLGREGAPVDQAVLEGGAHGRGTLRASPAAMWRAARRVTDRRADVARMKWQEEEQWRRVRLHEPSE
jgi:hypothetical protein